MLSAVYSIIYSIIYYKLYSIERNLMLSISAKHVEKLCKDRIPSLPVMQCSSSQQFILHFQGICSMDKLSTHLQRMWATGDLVDSVAPTTSVGRYDVSSHCLFMVPPQLSASRLAPTYGVRCPKEICLC